MLSAVLLQPLLVAWPEAQADVATLAGSDQFGRGWDAQVVTNAAFASSQPLYDEGTSRLWTGLSGGIAYNAQGVFPHRRTRALVELNAAHEELRELARGLHPQLLTVRGLAAAVRALAGRAPLPVTVVTTDDTTRWPPAIESAAYYVVAEALTNVAKYSGATSATIRVRRRDDVLVVEVADDGRGGAEASEGSGLGGLKDRVEALDGTFVVESTPGAGTRVRAELPLLPERSEVPA